MELSINEIEVDYTLVIGITKREGEVIQCSMKGFIVKEIAKKLFIAYTTVDTHIKNAKRKTGAKNMSQLVALYMKANKELFLSIFFLIFQGYIMFSNPNLEIRKANSAKVIRAKIGRKKTT